MPDIIFSDIVPYRYNNGPRLFPELDFYGTLLNNRNDFVSIWSFVTRFHTWIYFLALLSSDEADQAIISLQLLRTGLGLYDGVPADRIIDSPVVQYPSPPQVAGDETAEVSLPEPQKLSRARPTVYTDHQHPLLAAELQRPATFLYEGVIRNASHFAELDDAYNSHVKREPGLDASKDPSWSHTTELERERVGEMFAAIANTDSFYELRKARERLATVQEKANGTKDGQGFESPSTGEQDGEGQRPRKRRRSSKSGARADWALARPKGINEADWDLLDEENTPADLLCGVIHYRITNVEVEILCWRLLNAAKKAQRGFVMRPLWAGQRTVSMWDHYDTFGERWSAMCAELLDCKLMVHSLTRADWVAKFAGAPEKECGTKLSNDVLNGRRDVQNHVGRELIKERTSNKDWTTSEDFEIRTRDGNLVYKGGQLGDRARRQLALRQNEPMN